jgi:hypothetical protein
MEYADEKLETQDIALNTLIQSGTNKLERLEGLQVMHLGDLRVQRSDVMDEREKAMSLEIREVRSQLDILKEMNRTNTL